jgi:hypothetical protein
MISLGLSAADQAKFELSLITGYNLKIVVQILDLNHKYVSDVSDKLVDGQVNYSYVDVITGADNPMPATTTDASLNLLDPDNLVGFDTASPSDNALYADRMIKIVYSVYSDLLPRWVDCPIFCGPVVKVARDDALLSVDCQGKESLVSEPMVAWAAKTFKKGSKGVTAIRDLMASRGGETKFDLPEFGYTLGRDYIMAGESIVWTLAREMAGTTRQLFYDGRGVLRLRETSTRPIYNITENHITSTPKFDYDHSSIRNGVRVIGSINTLRAYRYLPTTNPSSPTALGRNGVKRHLMILVEDSTLTTQSAVNAAAQKLIDQQLETIVGFDFGCFPVPHLEPGDIIRLSISTTSIALRLREFSIPLRAGAQSMGSIKKLSINRARLRK